MSETFAVIGLGNPGSRYEGSRHNIGFDVVRALSSQYAQAGAGARWEEKFGCLYLRGRIAEHGCLFVLPQRFMNLSGEAAVPFVRYFRIPIEGLIVVHDELDLAPGVLRLKRGGSAAGHNGVSDIIRVLGSRDFYRLRVGIGHPRCGDRRKGIESSSGQLPLGDSAADSKGASDVVAWVLARPGPMEKELLEKAIPDACDAISLLISKGLKQAQQAFHRRLDRQD